MNKFMSVIALAVAAGVGFAQDTGEQVVDRVLAHYHSVKGVSVTMSMEIKVDDPAMAEAMPPMVQTAHAVVLKPDTFAFWPAAGEAGGDAGVTGLPTPWVYSDGEVMTAAVPDMEIYERKDAPESLAAMIAGGQPETGLPGGAWQLVTGADVVIELLAYEPAREDAEAPEDAESDEPGLLMEMLAEAEYKGRSGEGADARHVLLIKDEGPMGEMKFEVHIAAEGKPWMVALKPIMDEQPGFGGMSMIMRFTEWKSAEKLPDASKFTAAEDWERVEDLTEAIVARAMGDMEPQAPGEPEQAAGPAAGDAAVNFTHETLDGGSFTLADQAGKVVVLDFWATWCGPCVASLPSITKVAKAFEEKGVVFAAVNIAEDKDTVRAFMEKQDWDFRVAFDTEGSTATAYGVQFIPYTVVIDKKGVVRHVHVGLSPDEAEGQLRAELEALIGE